jgi:hypothetical protein
MRKRATAQCVTPKSCNFQLHDTVSRSITLIRARKRAHTGHVHDCKVLAIRLNESARCMQIDIDTVAKEPHTTFRSTCSAAVERRSVRPWPGVCSEQFRVRVEQLLTAIGLEKRNGGRQGLVNGSLGLRVRGITA